MVSELQAYYQEEILNHLPNKEIIQLIRESLNSNGKEEDL